MTYNLSCCGTTRANMETLNRAQRRLLRRTAGIFYPETISNVEIYEKCDSVPVEYTITKSRWELFGHILRQDQNTPANKFMNMYYVPCENRCQRGPPMKTLPVILAEELKRAKPTLTLHTLEDLQSLRTLASDRNIWRKEIVEPIIQKKLLALTEEMIRTTEKRKRKRENQPQTIASFTIPHVNNETGERMQKRIKLIFNPQLILRLPRTRITAEAEMMEVDPE